MVRDLMMIIAVRFGQSEANIIEPLEGKAPH